MAIFPYYPGISVQILNEDDEPLIEYQDTEPIDSQHPDLFIAEHHNLHTVSTYIESTTHSTFGIQLRVRAPYNMSSDAKLRFEINVDGNAAGVRYCSRPEYKRRGEWEEIVHGVKTWDAGVGKKGCKERKFGFAEIESVSDEVAYTTIQTQKRRLSNIGKITVSVFRVTCGKQGGASESTVAGFLKKRASVKAYEKAMKGELKSHGTYLQKAEKSKRSRMFKQTRKKDGDEMPMVIFQFLYRSKVALEKLLIINNQPEHEASPAQTDISNGIINLRNMKPHMAVKIENFIESLKEQNMHAKQEYRFEHQFEDDDGLSISGSRPAKRRQSSLGEQILIDLSHDNDGNDESDDDEVVIVTHPRPLLQAYVEDAPEEEEGLFVQ
ncbi:hypothetical protein B7463_g1582, partial [Scytalidium lignicola]